MELININISIILPVYNCYAAFVKGISGLKNSLADTAFKYELIVVNDGSEIDFENLNKEALQQHCTLIAYPQNKGKGYAVKKGVEAARGEIVLYMDGDLPFDTGIVKLAAHVLLTTNADIVIGDRTHSSSLIRSGSNWRKFGSHVVSMFANLFLVKNIPDTQCGFKAFKHEAAKKIFAKQTINGYSFDIEILYLAQRYNYTIASVPVVVNKQFGSNVKLIWHGLQMIFTILKIKSTNYR